MRGYGKEAVAWRGDERMHGGDTPGLVPGRGHERHEEPVRLGDREPGASNDDEAAPERDGSDALGGEAAARSGTARSPEDEQA